MADSNYHIIFVNCYIHLLNNQDQMPKLSTSFRTKRMGSSRPVPPPKPLSPVQLARIIGTLILLTVPFDVILLSSNFELTNRERISLHVVSVTLCLLVGLMCYVRRIVGYVQTTVLHSLVYTRSKLFGTVLIAILALVPLLIFFRQWKLSPDRKTALIALVAMAVGTIQVYQFIQGIITSLKSQDPETTRHRVNQGRLLATLLGFACARIVVLALAITLPRTAYAWCYYSGCCVSLLYLTLFLLHELELPVEIVPLNSMEVRTILRYAGIKKSRIGQATKGNRADRLPISKLFTKRK